MKLDRSVANHANRGKVFEKMLEQAHAYYAAQRLASVRRNPNEWRYTSEGQYRKMAAAAPAMVARTAKGLHLISIRSDVDFSGTIKGGRSIYFDAKECAETSIAISRFTQHQVDTLNNHAAVGAISGMMIRFVKYDRIFFLPAPVVDEVVVAMLYRKGKKSVNLADCVEKGIEILKGKWTDADWYESLKEIT